MRRFVFLVAAAVAAGSAFAQPSTPAISVDTLRDVDKTLSSDAFEGRKPTTPAEEKTTAYIVERFKAAGLQPGNHGSWFQQVPMVELDARNVSPLTFTGGKAPLALGYRDQMVIATYRVTPRVDIRNSDVVFVGYGIDAPEKGWNDYAGMDVKGKTVVILVNDPDWQTPGKDGLFDGKAMTYYGRWTYKFEEAARQGAAAAIIVHDTEPAAYPWAVVRSSWTGAQVELDEKGDHLDQSQATGWIQLDQAKALFASAGKDFAALSEAAKHKGFRAVPLGVKASVSFDNAVRRSMSKNVIGILPGTTKSDETVMYTAHWDHLGHCDPVNADGICNGALDNASGVAGLVALAEAQVKAGPAKRSMVFMSVTCEECGLLGSRYYAEHPVYPLAKMVGGVNMDVLNVIGPTRDFVVSGWGKSELDDLMRPLVEAQGRVMTPEPNPERGGYFRSDHFSFAKLGVPMFDGGSGEDLVDGGVAKGHAATLDYIANRYHKPQDEYDPNWNWAGAVQDLTLYFQFGRRLADDTSSWPNWYKTAEFRGIRDRSRAGQ
ncbi:M28 family peptidase [Sphingomonas sp.]|jgi:Zn-dependent M28 family amino/carboxypeptidase|uniref:M28 family peptidase n=1 Tax=Sphingomonas sp. TaxID=28214 RepID=UPI002E363225|nr:M28 family peptidase [Sphingomonas sp.]HEX4695310.1 M28 family peptidase [Sphingomonas sp.]